jgi:hypothetical protein
VRIDVRGAAPRGATAAVVPVNAVSCGSSRAGSTRCSFVNARNAASSIPAPLPAAVASAIAVASASSSPSSSGGRFRPDVSR